MKNRILVLAGVAALMIAAAIFVVAQGGPGHGRPHGDGDMVEHMSRALNLTDAQKAQVKVIRDAEKAATEPLKTRMEEIHKQVEAATANGQFDEAQVRALATQGAQAMADMMVEHIRSHTRIFAILTPEQRLKAGEMHKRGPGGPHGPGGPGGPMRHGALPPPRQ